MSGKNTSHIFILLMYNMTCSFSLPEATSVSLG